MYVVFVILLLLITFLIYITFRSFFENKLNRKCIQAVNDAYKRIINRETLSISEVNKFGSRVIAIDRTMGKLVLVIHKNGITWEKCISLNEILFCQVVKTNDKINGHIQEVSMELTLRNKNDIVYFPFFDEKTDNLSDLSSRSKKSKFWKKKIQYQLSTLHINKDNQNSHQQVIN